MKSKEIPRALPLTVIGSLILAFGLYNIHSISGVTEGGVLGLMLFIEKWTGLSPALSGLVMNALCYILGWKLLGFNFIILSAIANAAFSAFYAVFECFPRVYPAIADMPLAASLAGAVFIGVGAGLCVRVGSAPSGDDALAMSLSKAMRVDIRWVYLASDLIVLALSLTYIPLTKIAYSLLTVIISGQLVGFVRNFGIKKVKTDA